MHKLTEALQALEKIWCCQIRNFRNPHFKRTRQIMLCKYFRAEEYLYDDKKTT